VGLPPRRPPRQSQERRGQHLSQTPDGGAGSPAIRPRAGRPQSHLGRRYAGRDPDPGEAVRVSLAPRKTVTEAQSSSSPITEWNPRKNRPGVVVRASVVSKRCTNRNRLSRSPTSTSGLNDSRTSFRPALTANTTTVVASAMAGSAATPLSVCQSIPPSAPGAGVGASNEPNVPR
jgi:hypothetical protein